MTYIFMNDFEIVLFLFKNHDFSSLNLSSLFLNKLLYIKYSIMEELLK